MVMEAAKPLPSGIEEETSEPCPNKLSELPSRRRSKPEGDEPLDSNERSSDLLRHASFPAELVASQEQLPLLHVVIMLCVIHHFAPKYRIHLHIPHRDREKLTRSVLQ